MRRQNDAIVSRRYITREKIKKKVMKKKRVSKDFWISLKGMITEKTSKQEINRYKKYHNNNYNYCWWKISDTH